MLQTSTRSTGASLFVRNRKLHKDLDIAVTRQVSKYAKNPTSKLDLEIWSPKKALSCRFGMDSIKLPICIKITVDRYWPANSTCANNPFIKIICKYKIHMYVVQINTLWIEIVGTHFYYFLLSSKIRNLQVGKTAIWPAGHIIANLRQVKLQAMCIYHSYIPPSCYKIPFNQLKIHKSKRTCISHHHQCSTHDLIKSQDFVMKSKVVMGAKLNFADSTSSKKYVKSIKLHVYFL